jgi:hypothetical protein
MWGLWLLAAVAFSLVLAGCGGGGTTRVETVTETRTVSVASVDEQGQGTSRAARTVVRFWDYLAAGAVPVALDVYDPRVVRAVGRETLAGMLASNQATARELALTVKREQSVTRGTLVTAELAPESGAPTSASFIVSDDRILYDSFTAGALAAYVQHHTQREIDPDAKEPSLEAVVAGERAVRRFRQVYFRNS